MKLSKALSYFFIAAVILFLDVVLKAYVHYNIPPMHLSSSVFPYGGIGVFRDWHGIDFSITHVVNKGAAWGIFASIQEYLLYTRILIIGGLLSYLIFVKTSAFRKFCLMLIAIGATGNVIDSFVYGHVVDMFYFVFFGYSYPVFNVADASIFCGVVALLLEALFLKIKSGKTAKKGAKGAA